MTSSDSIHSVLSLCPPTHKWRIKVRVVRMWIADAYMGDNKPVSMELILLDQYGGKIQATIRKLLFRKWAEVIVEGEVYLITFFHLIPNMGSYRPTEHGFRILFNNKTNVLPCESSIIPRWGFSLKDSEVLNGDAVQSEYLVDVLGLLTAVSELRTYVKDGNTIRMVLIEISDEKGKVDCALFGEYADLMSEYVAANANEKPIIVFQLAKLKTFRGKNVLQNVMKASRIMFNPDSAEAISFRDRISIIDFKINEPVGQIITPKPAVPLFEDFMNNNAKKTIAGLNETAEDGCFIVLAKVVGLLQDDQWWYFACKCHKAVTYDDGLYYCGGCFKHVMDVIPRYRIKLEVSDESDCATFILFDYDAQNLLMKSCKEVLAYVKDPKCAEFPPMIEDILVGRELLFKVEKKSNSLFQYDESYRIKRVCDDAAIIDAYKLCGEVKVADTVAGSSTAVNLCEEKDISQGPFQSGEPSSPGVLTPYLGDGPSYVGSSGNLFKRKVVEESITVVEVPNLKLKQVKLEKE
ncbi:replication protein A 70 kDa DNA-binding subunit C-like [Lotus japonicus]|uniref:replication protein A 70 kDa DNA-binding subunit C-like n=1 Tax=Lotus japonicus TaxID=34305 RepID=UPI00258343A1|nr:replication protein A 70 kDa DNA-binding subunit C-like [Lotus japonicus]